MQQNPADGLQIVERVYNNADKIFNLYRNLPIACTTYGLGGIGNASNSTLSKDLRKQLMDNPSDLSIKPENYTIEEVACRVRKFFFCEHYQKVFPLQSGSTGGEPQKQTQYPAMGLVVAGYSSKAELPEIWHIWIDENGNCEAPELVAAQEDHGIYPYGQPEAIIRLWKGVGVDMPRALHELGVAQKEADIASQALAQLLEVPLHHTAMPIQDAIELAEFLVYATAMFFRFAPTSATVGGPVDIAAITKHEGFKWVKRKYFFDIKLNPKRMNDEYHV